MLIALAGPPCAGKRTIAQYLMNAHGFQPVCVDRSYHKSNNDGRPVSTGSGSQLPTYFASAEDLAHFVTSNWAKDYVLCSIEKTWEWEPLMKRPFCLLVAIDAPPSVRFARHLRKLNGSPSAADGSFADFCTTDEKMLYGEFAPPGSKFVTDVPSVSIINGGHAGSADSSSPTTTESPVPESTVYAPSDNDGNDAGPCDRNASLYFLMQRADARVFNPYASLDDLYSVLRILQLTNTERLRPSWDTYFMELCNLAARRSNCMKRRVGCILVKERRIIATGYNGTPRGVKNCNQGGCPRCNDNAPCGSSLDICLCLHAEENALLEAGRERVDRGGDTILYCNTCPCLGCAKKIVQVGVTEVVYSLAYGMDDMTARLLVEAGIKLRQHMPLDSDIVRSLASLDI
ncbi:Deoxycytidine monophosphate (dCMP) deaminase [Geranomyces michiganensis]|nr:Deoxycytidine monophosphate (dCMP) deaminase [Geranomyces michiganensis]